MAWTFTLLTPAEGGDYQVTVNRDSAGKPPVDLTVVGVEYDSTLRMYVYTLVYTAGGGAGYETWTLPIVKTRYATRKIVVRAVLGTAEKGRDMPTVQDGRG